MIQLLIYSVAAFGFAFIAGFSKISFPIRNWIDPGKFTTSVGAIRALLVMLIECPPCLGFWTGIVASAVLELRVFQIPTWQWIVLLALYTSGSNFILGRVTGLIPKAEEV